MDNCSATSDNNVTSFGLGSRIVGPLPRRPDRPLWPSEPFADCALGNWAAWIGRPSTSLPDSSGPKRRSPRRPHTSPFHDHRPDRRHHPRQLDQSGKQAIPDRCISVIVFTLSLLCIQQGLGVTLTKSRPEQERSHAPYPTHPPQPLYSPPLAKKTQRPVSWSPLPTRTKPG